MVSIRTSETDTPQSLREALSGPDENKWREAINCELDSLHKNKTWKVIARASMPPGAVPIKIKRDTLGNIVRYKARLTACGYAQRFGRDYTETFSPVASARSIRFLIALAAALRLQLCQHDVETAFLYGVLPENERVYLYIPDGLINLTFIQAKEMTIYACNFNVQNSF